MFKKWRHQLYLFFFRPSHGQKWNNALNRSNHFSCPAPLGPGHSHGALTLAQTWGRGTLPDSFSWLHAATFKIEVWFFALHTFQPFYTGSASGKFLLSLVVEECLYTQGHITVQLMQMPPAENISASVDEHATSRGRAQCLPLIKMWRNGGCYSALHPITVATRRENAPAAMERPDVSTNWVAASWSFPGYPWYYLHAGWLEWIILPP